MFSCFFCDAESLVLYIYSPLLPASQPCFIINKTIISLHLTIVTKGNKRFNQSAAPAPKGCSRNNTLTQTQTPDPAIRLFPPLTHSQFKTKEISRSDVQVTRLEITTSLLRFLRDFFLFHLPIRETEWFRIGSSFRSSLPCHHINPLIHIYTIQRTDPLLMPDACARINLILRFPVTWLLSVHVRD